MSGIKLLDNCLLTTGWFLTNCTLSNGVFTFSGIGTAKKEFAGDLPGFTPPRAYISITGSNLVNAACGINVTYQDTTYQKIQLSIHPTESDYYVAMDSMTNVTAVEIIISGQAGTVVNMPLFRPESTLDTESDQGISGDPVQFDTSYYGVKITKLNGLQIARDDSATDMLMNSDTFAFRAKDVGTGLMENKIYFDINAGTYVFDGVLSANVIQALSAVITPNLYAEKASIASLTVDELETSNKIQKFLNNDTSPVEYIKIFEKYIQFITEDTPTTTISVNNRYGQQLYWMDESHTAATETVTEWPVQVYQYTNKLIKLQLAFEAMAGVQVPSIVLGAGDATGYSKGYFYKTQTGVSVEYTKSNTGAKRQLVMDDGSVRAIVAEYTPVASLRNVVVTTGAPDVSMGNLNDIIFKI